MADVDIYSLEAKLSAAAAVLDERATPDAALTEGRLVPALRLVREALGLLERARTADIKPDLATAALALACRITGRDVDGLLIVQPDYQTGGELVRKATASLEAFAAAIVDAAVQAAVLAAPRVRACSRCDHLFEDRLKFLDEIEGLNLTIESLREQATAYRCKCGGGRPPYVITADLLSAADPRCGCVESGVHGCCVGHCPESAARARARMGKG